MTSRIAIDVAAPAELVHRLARDVERWPVLLPHYVSVDVERRDADGAVTARFVARRELVRSLGFGVPVAWRSRTWNEPDPPRLHFRHVGGATNGMAVTWLIEPTDAGCHVAIEHDFQPRIALWAPLLDRLLVRPIARRTLRTFKALAEALA
jgi:ribosome-associated toxin RatA of RatAB toxin-antitoxin module